MVLFMNSLLPKHVFDTYQSKNHTGCHAFVMTVLQLEVGKTYLVIASNIAERTAYMHSYSKSRMRPHRQTTHMCQNPKIASHYSTWIPKGFQSWGKQCVSVGAIFKNRCAQGLRE